MRYADHRVCKALAAALLLADLVPCAWAATIDGDPSALAALDGKPTLAVFRQYVWSMYSASAAIGPDARGRTVAQDIATWVLPTEVRRQLNATDPDDEAARLEEPQRRVKLIGLYWSRQFTLRNQRTLWLQALQVAPAAEAQSSRLKIDALESRLQRDYAPTMTLQSLTDEINELVATYDRERQRLFGLRPEIGGLVFDRSADLPCTRLVAPKPATGPSRRLQLLWSPTVADFYPKTAKRDQLTGKVFLKIAADDTGCLQHIEVLSSSGAPALDAAAIDLAARIELSPALRDGKPVASTTTLPIAFTLNGVAPLDATPATAPTAPGFPAPSMPTPSVAEPNSAEHYKNGNAYLNSGKDDQAIAELDLAIAMDPTAALAYADRGLAHLRRYESTQAHDDFEAALRLAPNNAIALRGRGDLEYLLGDCMSAQVDLTRALEVEARSGFALRLRAEVDSCLSQDSDALVDLATAEKIEPKAFSAYSRRALVLRALGRPDEALAEIDAMLAVSSESQAELTAGAIYAEAGKPDAAAAALDLGVSLAANEKSYIARARFRPAEDFKAQREDYAAALKANPESKSALYRLIILSALDGEDSPANVGTVLASHPDDAIGLMGRGIDRWLRGERRAADQDLRAAIEHASNAELNDVCYALGVVNVALDRALEACNRALAPIATLPTFLDSRALVYLRRGQLREALADYDLALKLRPHFAHALYGRGLVLIRLRRSRPADEAFAAALRLDATSAAYFHAMHLDR